MKNKLPILLVALLAVPFVIGCSSNSRGYTRARLCLSAEDPINLDKMTKGFSRKVALKPGENFAPSGEYTYAGTTVYVYDKTQNVKLLLRHNKTRDGEFSKEMSLDCIAGKGVTPNMNRLIKDIPIVSNILVSDNNVKIKLRTLNFDFGPNEKKRWLDARVTDEDAEYTVAHPADPFQGAENVDLVFFTVDKTNDTVHRIVGKLTDTIKNDKDGRGKDSNLEIRIAIELRSKAKASTSSTH